MNENDIEKSREISAWISKKQKIETNRKLFDESFLKIVFHESLWRISRIYLSSTASGVEKGGKERDTRHGTVTVSFPLWL